MKQILTLLVGTALIFTACQSEADTNKTVKSTVESGVFERLSVADFQTKLAANPKPQLIDVRTPKEFAAGAIERAVNINYHDKDFLKQMEVFDKSKPVFVYCQAGGRSLKSAKKLQFAGFKEIYELETGYSGWEQ